MVEIVKVGKRLDLYDFSLLPSLECDLSCWFCMYAAGPSNQTTLNHAKTAAYVATWDWSMIPTVGFYGGEPSINTELYQRFIDLLPPEKPRFTISNGAWSTDRDRTHDFLRWCGTNALRVIVSGTPEHTIHQNRKLLENMVESNEWLTVKGDDDIHPMGRAAGTVSCTQKCGWHEQQTRLAVFPTGDIILQNCDGAYPVISDYTQPFGELDKHVRRIRQNGCCQGYPSINDVTRALPGLD